MVLLYFELQSFKVIGTTEEVLSNFFILYAEEWKFYFLHSWS